MNAHLRTHCRIESVLDKLIHPGLNWLTSSIRQTLKMPLKHQSVWLCAEFSVLLQIVSSLGVKSDSVLLALMCK